MKIEKKKPIIKKVMKVNKNIQGIVPEYSNNPMMTVVQKRLEQSLILTEEQGLLVQDCIHRALSTISGKTERVYIIQRKKWQLLQKQIDVKMKKIDSRL